MARPAKKTAVPETHAPDIARPPQPKRYKASKDELLKLYREMLLIRRFEERAGSSTGWGSSAVSAISTSGKKRSASGFSRR